MQMQVRPPTEQSFWNLSEVSWVALTSGNLADSSHPWVTWQGRTWVCKFKPESICEVIGYQIAEAFELPLQPWIAFYQTQSPDKCAPRSGVGMLVERWVPFCFEGDLREPAKTHPDLVGRALAFAVLEHGFEWPRWLMSKDKSELRLFDLETIGPFLHWPPGRSPLSDYRESTRICLADARQEAYQAGVHQVFERHLEIVKTLDFRQIIDLSGCPRGEVVKRKVLRGLEARQRQILRILDCGQR